MSRSGDGHTHDEPAAGQYDWFKILDIMVWVSVAIITAMAIEWFMGKLVREKISRDTSRYLQKVTAKPAAADPPA